MVEESCFLSSTRVLLLEFENRLYVCVFLCCCILYSFISSSLVCRSVLSASRSTSRCDSSALIRAWTSLSDAGLITSVLVCAETFISSSFFVSSRLRCRSASSFCWYSITMLRRWSSLSRSRCRHLCISSMSLVVSCCCCCCWGLGSSNEEATGDWTPESRECFEEEDTDERCWRDVSGTSSEVEYSRMGSEMLGVFG